MFSKCSLKIFNKTFALFFIWINHFRRGYFYFRGNLKVNRIGKSVKNKIFIYVWIIFQLLLGFVRKITCIYHSLTTYIFIYYKVDKVFVLFLLVVCILYAKLENSLYAEQHTFKCQ